MRLFLNLASVCVLTLNLGLVLAYSFAITMTCLVKLLYCHHQISYILLLVQIPVYQLRIKSNKDWLLNFRSKISSSEVFNLLACWLDLLHWNSIGFTLLPAF